VPALPQQHDAGGGVGDQHQCDARAVAGRADEGGGDQRAEHAEPADAGRGPAQRERRGRGADDQRSDQRRQRRHEAVDRTGDDGRREQPGDAGRG